jgi:hypothetical protein
MTDRTIADIVADQNPLVLAAHETVQQACKCRDKEEACVL